MDVQAQGRDLGERWKVGDWHLELAMALILAVLNAAGALVDDPGDAGASGWWPAAVAAASGLVLVARRVLPLGALAAVLGLLTVVSVQEHQTSTTTVTLLFASHAVGRWSPGARGIAGLVAIWAFMAGLAASGDRYFTQPIAVALPVIYSLPWLLGRFQLARAKDVAAEREEARLAERDRIARELHDIVTHSLTAISVDAATARHLGTTGTDATTTFGRIEDLSRQALVDLRRMLDLLRDDQGAPVSPSPAMADLRELVDTHAAIHGPVRLDIDPALTEVTSGVALAVYRIVQESLTNIARHGAGAPARVDVRAGERVITVTVEDDGAANGRPPGRTTGGQASSSSSGLTGMRERVAVFGGTLIAEPRPGGGYRVHAEIPDAR